MATDHWTDRQHHPDRPGGDEQTPSWLTTPRRQPATDTRPSRRRTPLLLTACGVAVVAVAAVTVAGLRVAGSADAGAPTHAAIAAPVAVETAATPATTPTPAVPLMPTTTPAAPAVAWCVDGTVPGGTVGRGPRSTADGPGAIREFDHAYYVDRDGGRVASLMVTPNPVPDIQKWIDQVPAGTEHCVTVVATADPNVYTVDLVLRMPGAEEGVIRQRVTVAPSPTGFRIAKVEDVR